MRGEGIGILLTEQNYRLALDVADRVYFIEKGQVDWEGTAEKAGAPEVIARYLAVSGAGPVRPAGGTPNGCANEVR